MTQRKQTAARQNCDTHSYICIYLHKL